MYKCTIINIIFSITIQVQSASKESRSSGLERKVGGQVHLKLNKGSRPRANK